jgi:lysophospholipase L1-like esterase
MPKLVYHNIVVFGDSIAAGAWDKEGGWVTRLNQFLQNKSQSDPSQEVFIYNASISGDTTQDVLKRFNFEMTSRISSSGDNTIIFAIGINDSYVRDNERITSINEFEKNIRELIKQARAITKNIYFVGFTPVDESKTQPTSFSPDVSYTAGLVLEYNQKLESICEEEGIQFIDIYKELMKSNLNDFLCDGVHPNTEGHKKIFELVSKKF